MVIFWLLEIAVLRANSNLSEKGELNDDDAIMMLTVVFFARYSRNLQRKCETILFNVVYRFLQDFKKECPSGRLNKAQFQKYYKKLADADDQDGHMSE